MADVEIIGLRDLGDTLDLLGQKMERKIVRNASRAGARVFRDEVERRAPKLTGELEKEVAIKDYPLRQTGGYVANVGIRYKGKVAASSRRKGKKPSSEDPGVYAVFDELGRPGKTGHTKQAAQPFIRPSFDAKKGAAEQAFADRASAEIEEALKK